MKPHAFVAMILAAFTGFCIHAAVADALAQEGTCPPCPPCADAAPAPSQEQTDAILRAYEAIEAAEVDLQHGPPVD